jgi:hypothetical protein
VGVKANGIQAALKQKTSFLYETEIFVERKIGKCIVD